MPSTKTTQAQRSFALDRLRLRKSEVLRYLGYRRHATELTPRVDHLLDDCLAEAPALITGRAVTVDLEAAVRAGGVQVLSPAGRQLELKSVRLADHLQGCRRLTLLVVTAGPGLEDFAAAEMLAGNYARGVIFDAIGSEAVEAAADAVEAEVAGRAAAEGAATTWRFSPGYGDWSLDAQPALLELTGAAGLGISLTEAQMLKPQKSVSAVIGWYPCPDPEGMRAARRERTKCRGCGQGACSYRRVPAEEVEG